MRAIAISVLACTLSFLSLEAAADQQAAAPAPASDAPAAKDAKVRELLRLMKATDMAVQGIDGMIAAMKGAMPQVKEEYWTKFRAEIKVDEFLDLLVPIYAENFDVDELEGLIQFYQSPVGRRFVEKQGVVMQQSMAAGQKWGAQVAERVLQQLNKPEGK